MKRLSMLFWLISFCFSPMTSFGQTGYVLEVESGQFYIVLSAPDFKVGDCNF